MANTLAIKLERGNPHKTSLVDDLARAILKLAQSKTFTDTLPDVERMTLAIAMEKDEPLPYGDLALRLMLTGLVRIEGHRATGNKPTVDDVLTRLLKQGLLVNLSETWGSSTLRTLVAPNRLGLPTEVRKVLPATLHKLTPAESGLILADEPQPALVSTRDRQQFLRELLFCWSELRQQPARQLKAGGMGKRDRRRLATALGLDEDSGLTRIEQLYEILQALNLISEDGSTVTAVESDAATLFWGAKPAQHHRDVLRAYTRLTAPLVDETGGYRLYGYYQGIVQRPDSEMRQRVLSTLENSVDLGWLPFSLFLKLLTAGRTGGFILNEETLSIAAQHLRWHGTGYHQEVESRVQGYERLVARSALDELYTLGFVDLGYQAADSSEPVAIRATPGLRPEHQSGSIPNTNAEAPWQIILQPDFQMLALGPVPLRTLASLEQFAAREKVDESVITYRLNRDATYRALQRGETVKYTITPKLTGTPTSLVYRIEVAAPDGSRSEAYSTKVRTGPGSAVYQGALRTALNDQPGTWTLTATEIVSGQSGRVSFRVAP